MKNIFKCAILLMVILSSAISAFCQLNTVGSMYYQNQYLTNAAFAGVQKGWEINGSYKSQWSAIDGAPNLQTLTLGYGAPNQKVGIGLYVYNESAGVLRRSSIKATYAYHLPLNSEDQFLDMGISAGVQDEWVDLSKAVGDLSEETITNFNQRKLYFDGDFGAAFRTRHLTLQASIPNLKKAFNKTEQRNIADRSAYMASISYKIFGANGSVFNNLEPRLTYRGVQNFDDIIDAGLNAQFFGNKLMLSSIYHSTNSVTSGIGTTYKDQFSILCQYTTNTAALQTYSNGEFEIAIKYTIK